MSKYFENDVNKFIDPKCIENFFDRMWPLMRSITGKGYRKTHKIISEIVPLKKISFKTGEKVFDWEIPHEWIYNDAYVIDPTGKKILESKRNNLHLVNYSKPINKKISFEKFKKKLYFLKERPDSIPYITSYYKRDWGFCTTYKEFKKMIKGNYEVFIDTKFKKGELFVSEAYLPGSLKKEIFFSSYTCHPSMANNELSGPLINMFLYNYLSIKKDRKYSYRFLFSAETIGTIAYLSKMHKVLEKNLIAGYVLTCIGDENSFNYKRSREINLLVNQAAENSLKFSTKSLKNVYDYFPWGSDERQYCSLGIDLPVGCITRSMYGNYEEYHTSDDNKNIINFNSMVETVQELVNICDIIETNKIFKTVEGKCEPFLSKYGLYDTLSETRTNQVNTNALRWLLAFSDGKTDLIKISNMSNIKYDIIYEAAKLCIKNNLIKEI